MEVILHGQVGVRVLVRVVRVYKSKQGLIFIFSFIYLFLFVRSCTNPLPMYGGNYCSGSPINVTSCNSTQPCPVDGSWTTWSNFSACSGTCGNSTMSRIVS